MNLGGAILHDKCLTTQKWKQGFLYLNCMVMRYSFIITGVIFFMLTSCRSMKEPVFNGIENVVINKVGAGKSSLTFNIAYFNPNNIKARLKSAEGDAWLDSTYLGHFFVDTTIDIPANASFIIPARLDVEMKNMLKHSLSAFLNEQVLITIKGKAKVGKSGIYKKFPLLYEGKQNLAELFNY
jgi:hypothetical protein